MDQEGEFDGSFNTNFLKLSAPEKKKNLELAKVIPFSETNVELDVYKRQQWEAPITDKKSRQFH